MLSCRMALSPTGLLWALLIKLLNRLAAIAADAGKVVIRELLWPSCSGSSIGLCRGYGALFRVCVRAHLSAISNRGCARAAAPRGRLHLSVSPVILCISLQCTEQCIGSRLSLLGCGDYPIGLCFGISRHKCTGSRLCTCGHHQHERTWDSRCDGSSAVLTACSCNDAPWCTRS